MRTGTHAQHTLEHPQARASLVEALAELNAALLEVKREQLLTSLSHVRACALPARCYAARPLPQRIMQRAIQAPDTRARCAHPRRWSPLEPRQQRRHHQQQHHCHRHQQQRRRQLGARALPRAPAGQRGAAAV